MKTKPYKTGVFFASKRQLFIALSSLAISIVISLSITMYISNKNTNNNSNSVNINIKVLPEDKSTSAKISDKEADNSVKK